MDQAGHLQRLRDMLSQVVPREIQETPGAALEFPELPGQLQEAAATGFARLVRHEEITRDQQHTLEAIILPQFRPAVNIIGGTFSTPPFPWEHLGHADVQPKLVTSIQSIGRIEVPRHPSVPYAGTGFVVGPNLMMTNRHVAQIFATGLGQRQLSFKPGRTAAVDFRREVIATAAELLLVKRVVMIHPCWDMALLEVEGLSANHPMLKLSVEDPDALAEHDVAVIGYPAQDWRNDTSLQNQVFGGVYNVKRLQPGKLKVRRTIESFGNNVSAVTHDASTLGGNSGSAVIDVQSDGQEFEVVALHFAGLYLDANFAVPTFELARDDRVVQAGVNFAKPLPSATQDWAALWRLADRLQETAVAAAPAVSHPFAVSAPGVSFTVPLTVTVSLGSPPGSPAPAGFGPPSSLTAPASSHAPATAESQTIEGLFGTADTEVVRKAYDKFRSDRLHRNEFSWENALATADCSHVVYEVPSVVISTCRNKWQLQSCEFVSTDDTECFVASSEKAIIVSFRGTKGVRDWLIDLNSLAVHAQYGTVHRGFYFAFQSVKSSLETLIRRENPAERAIILTGHSLGGALATIAAAEWREMFSISSVYTFGQPCVGRNDFRTFLSGHYANNFFRFVNDDDIVPRVPPGYVHFGRLYHFGADGSVGHESVAATTGEPIADTLSDDEFAELKVALESEKSGGATESAGLEGWVPSISDHKLDRYLAQILTNQPS